MTAAEAARIEWHRHIHEHGCSGWSWHCPTSRTLYRAYIDAINRTR